MQGMPDVLTNTEQRPSIAPQQMAASATVNGTGIDVADREHVVMELSLGGLAGAPTGGTITLTPQESDSQGSGFAQVNSDTVVAQFNDTLPEVLRYRYLGGALGKRRYVRLSVTTALTGGSSPTIQVAGNVLTGGMRFAGAQPAPGSAPQTPGTPLAN